MGDLSHDQRRRRVEDVVAEVGLPLQRYLRRRADASTADDVLGDVLLVLWRRADDIPSGDPLPWCYGVARRCLANHVRGRKRHLRLLQRLSAVRVEEAATASGDAALDAALAALPATDAEVLRLWAWEELEPREIAPVLGITPNAASIRLHRAKARLRSALSALSAQAQPDQAQPRKDGPDAGHLGDRQGTEAPR